MQKKNLQWLSYVQASHLGLQLSRSALQRGHLSSTILSKNETRAEVASTGAEVCVISPKRPSINDFHFVSLSRLKHARVQRRMTEMNARTVAAIQSAPNPQLLAMSDNRNTQTPPVIVLDDINQVTII